MLNPQVFASSLSCSELGTETDCSCSCFISDQKICSVDKIKRVALFAFILSHFEFLFRMMICMHAGFFQIKPNCVRDFYAN